MRDPRIGPEREDIAVSATIGLPFSAYLGVMALVAAPTDEHWARADPILTLWPRGVGVWAVCIGGVVAAAAWTRVARPSREVFGAELRGAAIGVLLAAVAVGLLRWGAGPVLPSFIPPEESAGPGFVLSMTAGYGEEVVCRLGILPICYFALRRRGALLRFAAPVVVTGLFFALWHLAGEQELSARFFLTRFFIPGCGMSLLWFASPSAVVAAHCTAHLLIPALFLSPV